MKLLITGVAGFIGSHVAAACLKKGYFVIGIDNLNSYYDPKLKEDRLKFLYEIAEGEGMEKNFKFLKKN